MSGHKTRQTTRIVEAALQVIDQAGFSGVTMSSVAARAGVARQTIYNYFPDVESIVARALTEHSAAMEAHMLAIFEDAEGLFEQMKALAEFEISHATPEHSGLNLEAGLSAQIRDQVATHADVVKAALIRAIKTENTRGKVSLDLEPGAASEVLWGIVDGAVTGATKHPDQKPNLIHAAVKAMSTVIAPQKQPSPERERGAVR